MGEKRKLVLDTDDRRNDATGRISYVSLMYYYSLAPGHMQCSLYAALSNYHGLDQA